MSHPYAPQPAFLFIAGDVQVELEDRGAGFRQQADGGHRAGFHLVRRCLVAAAEEVFAKEKAKKPLATVISAPRVTIREKIELITKTMKDLERASFSSLTKGSTSRLEIVVTFLAMLELIKRYRVQAHQEGLFSDIEINRMDDWSEDEEIEIEFE